MRWLRYPAQPMRQNIYDDAEFFAGYQAMRARRSGAHETIVEPLLSALMPDLGGSRVLDIGCGDRWFTRRAVESGAASVLGVDPSSRMLALAADRTSDSRVQYRQGFIEDIALAEETFDCVVSIFTLHYVEDLPAALSRVASWLVPGGMLAVVMEHPIYLASSPDREFDQRPGRAPRWLLSGYADEGRREEHWFTAGVVKYHRRVSTILNALIDAGLVIERVAEPTPGPPVDPETAAEDSARPVVLGLRARRAASST